MHSELGLKLDRFLIIGLVQALVLFSTVYARGDENHPKIKVIHTVPAYAGKVDQLDHVSILIQFNREIDPSIQEDAVLDQRGATDEAGNPIEIKGQISWPDPKTFKFVTQDPLKPNSTYQISLFSVRSPTGEEMEEVPFRLVFTTGTGKRK